MRVLFTSVFLLAASFLTSHALAGECTPVSRLHGAAQVTEPKAIAIYNAVFNAFPPQSNESYPAVYLVILPGGVTEILLGNSDEVCAKIRVPSSAIEGLIRRALGEPV